MFQREAWTRLEALAIALDRLFRFACWSVALEGAPPNTTEDDWQKLAALLREDGPPPKPEPRQQWH